MRIGALFTFEAAHHLPYHGGGCQQLHGHGYKLEVVVNGQIQGRIGGPEEGMVLDLKELKKIVKDVIVDPLDHTNLNDFYKNPTVELMVENIVESLKIIFDNHPHTILTKVKLWETATAYAEWRVE